MSSERKQITATLKNVKNVSSERQSPFREDTQCSVGLFASGKERESIDRETGDCTTSTGRWCERKIEQEEMLRKRICGAQNQSEASLILVLLRRLLFQNKPLEHCLSRVEREPKL